MKFLITVLFISLTVAAVLAQDETESTTTSGTETSTGGHGHGHIHGGGHGQEGHGKRGICCIFRPEFGCCTCRMLIKIVIFSFLYGKKL